MLVLGIESSCDETGVALVHWHDQSMPKLLSHALYSQIDMHQAFGGVVPELASRDHIRRVLPLTQEVLLAGNRTLSDVDVVAYTRGPGLAGALLVGAGVACALGAALDKPVLGVHHLEGHLLSPFLSADPPEFPFVALLVSGGHTQLMRVDGVGRYQLLGETIDDAAGEAFDKSAKLMGLGYPGGPALAKMAEQGDAAAYALPRPLLKSGNLDFSFAGLKTAVLVQAQRMVAAERAQLLGQQPPQLQPTGSSTAGDVCAQFSLQLRRAGPGGEGVAHSSLKVGKGHAAKFSFGGDALPCRGNLFDLADDTGRIFVSGYHSFIFLSNGSCAQAADLQTDRSGGNRMRLCVPYCHTITHCNAVN